MVEQLSQAKGYELAVPPEAAPLRDACDAMLVRTDGMNVSLLLVVDADRDPKRHFGAPLALVERVGAACRAAYAGVANGARLPVFLEIVELRADVTEADVRRMRGLRKLTGVVIAAYLIPREGAIRINGWAPYLFVRRRLLARALGPGLPAALPTPVLPERRARPLFTVGLLALLTAVFLFELGLPVRPAKSPGTPSLSTLIAFGALDHRMVSHGDVTRLLTSAFLHASPLHLFFNGIALWFAGKALEGFLGPLWLAALFVIGALGGGLGSLVVNSADVVSVGASGAIMALFVVALVMASRLPIVERTRLQSLSTRVLVASLLPLATVHTEGRTDYAAHMGGAVAGVFLALLLRKLWARDQERPRARGLALAICVLGGLTLAWSAAQLPARRAGYATFQ